MLEELKQLAARVTTLLGSDPFPALAEPDILRAAVRDYPLRGGKRLRPALVVWACCAAGGDPEKALCAAAACEVFHNWTLVHDDIIDADDLRRNFPTCHRQLEQSAQRAGVAGAAAGKFGRDFAILTGDCQQAWANFVLLKLADTGAPPELVVQLAADLQKMGAKLIAGEALDVEMSRRDLAKISVEEVERMYALKTGALFEFCAAAGARIALNDAAGAHPFTRALGKMALEAAVAFQLKDDCLGLFGNQATFGKPVGSDLSERKATTLILHTLERLPAAERAGFELKLGQPEYSPSELDEIREIVRRTGALELVRNRASELAAAARRELVTLPESRHRTLLAELLDYLLNREV